LIEEGATDNLMDYGRPPGTKLWKYQWDLIHDPENVLFSWTEEGEEGAAIIEFPTCTKMEIERFRAAYIHGNSVSFIKDKGFGFSADDIKLLDGKKYDVIGITVSEDVDFWPHTINPTVEIKNEYAYFNLGNGVEFYTSEDDYRNKGVEDYLFPDTETKKQSWETELNGLKQSLLNNLKEDNPSELLKELAILPESETNRLTDKEKDDILNYLATVNSKPSFSCVEWPEILSKVSVESKGNTPLDEDWVIESIKQFISDQEEEQDIVEFYNTHASGDIRKDEASEDRYFLYKHSNNKVNLYANKYADVGLELSSTTEMSFNILTNRESIEFNIDFKDLANEQLILRFRTKDLADFENQFNDLGYDGAQMKKAMTNRLWAALYKTKDFHEFRTLVKYIPDRLSHDEKTKCINTIYDESKGKFTTDEHNIICSLIENVNSSDDAEKMVAWLKSNPQILDKLFSSIDDWSADKFSSIAEAVLVLYYKQDKGIVIAEGKDVDAENLFEWNPPGNTNKFQFDIPESWDDYWSQAEKIRDDTYTISYSTKYENEKFVIKSTYHFVDGPSNYSFSFDPFETVSVYFAVDNKHVKAGGWTVPMPSIYLAWLINQGERDANQTMLSIGTTAVSMAFGIGELNLALKGSKYIKVAITGTLLIKNINDFLLENDGYKDEIRELLGQDFVTKYKQISNIIDVVLISKQTISGELEEKVNALGMAWNKIDEQNLKQLETKYPELYKLINREIEKIKSLQ
ncbi:MAG: hypothetical protein ACQETL_20010, partial [Bacteroidota bacterium]